MTPKPKKKPKGRNTQDTDGRAGFLIYLSTEEKAAMQRAADSEERFLSHWIRRVALEAAGEDV